MWKLLGRFFWIVVFLSQFGFGEDFEKICNEEVLKEDFDITVIKSNCLKTAKKYQEKKFFSNASWYFLLIGENNKNINEIQPQIDDGLFVNIGHSYLLKENITKATEYYRGYIDKAMQPNSDIKNDFKLLNKLYPNKKELLIQGLKIWNRLYQPLVTIDTLYDKYDQEEKLEKYGNAIKTLEKIIDLRKKHSIKETDIISTDYSNLAILYGDIGNYKKALNLSLTALRIDKQILGLTNHQIAIDYSNLAYIYEKVSKFKEAEQYNFLAIEVFKKLYGEKNHNLATTYNNLAFLYSSIGNYNEALELYKKSLIIDRELLNEKNASISVTLNNIGEIYSLTGDYPKAMSYYQDALKNDINNYGKNHTITAHSYNNIAQMYELLEDYKRAKNYYKKALKIAKSRLHENHPFLSTLYANLGNLYYVMNEDVKSFKEHNKSLEIRKFLAKGEVSIDMALSYHAMGLLYQANQDYNKSLEYFQKTLDINRELLSKDNIANSITYSSMATLYQQMNNKEKALKFHLKALALEKKILGKNHRDLARTYNSLSLLYFSKRDNKMAYLYMKKAFKIFKYNQHQNFTLLDNHQRQNYTKQHHYYFNNILYLTNKNRDYKNFLFATNLWLNYKGTLFEYQNLISMIENDSKTDTETKKYIQELKKLTINLDNLDNYDIKFTNYQDKKLVIEEKIHNIEVTLSKQNQNFKERLDLQRIDYRDISNRLKANQLYIDFAKGEKNYYIFTLDSQENITFEQIDDNFTKDIDSNITKFLNINHKIAEDVNNIELIKTLQLKTTKILSNLQHKLITKNINRKDKNELIISPDGLLNFLPFEALFDGKKYLVEDYTISYISSGREFIRQIKRKKQTKLSKVIIFANPDFKLELAENSTKGTNITETLFDIDPLVKLDARKEIAVIKSHYREVIVYQEENATVDNLFKINPPKILHISTHGILLNNNNILNPMKRSVLAFSGADNAKYQGDARGFATALKLSSLNLEGTELVVLSACDTGLGEIHQAEGVIGLPKAFIQAGAKRVIMSLWSVSNNQTALLMGYFYDNISSEKNYAMALREAKLKMINLHPYFWSAFIINGI